MASNIPVIVQGNSFNLAIPLQIYVINGDQMELQDYTPDPTDQISIQLKGSRRNYTYTPTSVTDNVCMIALGGYELADNYSVVVSIVKADGQRLRSFRTDQFFIVESSDDLTQDDIIEGLEENVIYLNSSIFVAGADGRGITSIIKTSTAGLVDTYTITYTDETTSTFNVTNGAPGSQGQDGVGITSIEKTATAGLVDTYTITLSNGNTSTFDVTNGKDGYDLGLASIINNLTTGGSTDALSAEMGKVLKNEFDGATQITSLTSTNGYRINYTNGYPTADSGSSYTSPLSVTKGQIVKAIVTGVNSNHAVIAKVQTVDTLYKNIASARGDTNKSEYVWTADEDCQIAISFKTANGYRLYIMNDTSGLWDNVMGLKALEPKIDDITQALSLSDYTLLSRLVKADGAGSWGKNYTIVGYDKTFPQRSLLDKVKMCIFSAAIGGKVIFYLGKIDQRNWLLPRLTFTAYVTSLEPVEGDNNNRTCVIDLSSYNIIAEEGEVLFFSPQPITSNNATFAYSIGATITGTKLFATSDINTALTEQSNKGVRWVEITAKQIDTYLALKADVDEVNNMIEQQAKAIAESKIYYDRTTGEAYKIIVNNGAIQLKSLTVNNLLVLCHSFGAHPETGFWVVSDNRGMAATIADNDYPTKLKGILGASTLVKKNVADWERNLVNYDYATNWAVTDDYEAIVLFAGANMVDSEHFKSGYLDAIAYLKQAAPTADIYIVSIGSPSYNSAREAAAESKVAFVDITYLNKYPLGNLMGGYYIGKNNNYYPITLEAVAGHPADYGQWLIAQGIALGMGSVANNLPTHNIILNQSNGGTISAAASVGIENGVISIKCDANEGYMISSLTVTDGSNNSVIATARTNDSGTFYTFIMPSSDVTVTPTWVAE